MKSTAKISRDKLMIRLATAGIETRTFFFPMHLQPALLKLGLFADDKHLVTEDISGRGLYLPNGVNLTKQQIDYVCDRIEEAGK